jgi:hypothetical protein
VLVISANSVKIKAKHAGEQAEEKICWLCTNLAKKAIRRLADGLVE